MTVGIVGLGLIGGSIGLALREPGRKILGYDPNPNAVKVAKDRFCIDQEVSLEDVCQADFIFVTVPPAVVVEVLDTIHSLRSEVSIYTDCTSAKGHVANWAENRKDPNFIPGHPMAGHENSGAAYASAWMFRGARWILCPTHYNPAKTVNQLEHLVKGMGATPVRMAASDHDRQIATLSHLPHVLAGALVLLKDQMGAQDVGGGSWKDLTRVGGVDPELWTQIFMENRQELSSAIQEIERILEGVRESLEQPDIDSVKQFLTDARKAKSKDGPQDSKQTKS